MDWHRGTAGHRGRPGYAAALPRADAPGAAARRQVRAPGQARMGHPPPRPRELAKAQAVNGREHQGNEPDPTEPGELSRPVAMMVRGLSPSPAVGA